MSRILQTIDLPNGTQLIQIIPKGRTTISWMVIDSKERKWLTTEPRWRHSVPEEGLSSDAVYFHPSQEAAELALATTLLSQEAP